jgi:hypothetical protein
MGAVASKRPIIIAVISPMLSISYLCEKALLTLILQADSDPLMA